MTNSFFYLQIPKNSKNHRFIDDLEPICNETKEQAYLINKPLADPKYSYSYEDAAVLLMPKHKITFLNFSNDSDGFNGFIADFIEDLGSISDKFRYKDFIGRPRSWEDLLKTVEFEEHLSAATILEQSKIEDPKRQRICELLISLLTGSINDIERVKADLPETILDKVKRKILLFDGDQTRFIYGDLKKPEVRIQGLSGTGKTELLLHKLKELYIEDPKTKIVFTCHNKILADNLHRRIPEFFNFMKVEQQILWKERVWCMHAWGSYSDPNSGTYRFVCHYYGVPFETYGYSNTFDVVCRRAIEAIQAVLSQGALAPAFDYMLIDESQDFPQSFFQLCKLVTRNVVYIAGDIFQSIFDAPARDSIEPDYLLSKCYRTDPRTLMFAHGLGMGLFETQKLRWLDDDEWRACGYSVERNQVGDTVKLRREPLRRFEDVDKENFKSIHLAKVKGTFYEGVSETILSIIEYIKCENPTVTADDIGIILLDSKKSSYALADSLAQAIPRATTWRVNKAHETKRKEKGQIFVSNRNNVKGLEFPFVICVTEKILNSNGFRNALYMTLTRSFLQTYLVLSETSNESILPCLDVGLNNINQFDFIEAKEPSTPEKEAIRTTIKHSDSSISFFDFVANIFNEIGVPPTNRKVLFDTVQNILGEDYDYENVKDLVAYNFLKMQGANNETL